MNKEKTANEAIKFRRSVRVFSDEDLESIIAQLPQNTKESSSIQEPDFSQFNLSNNELESIKKVLLLFLNPLYFSKLFVTALIR